MPVQDLTPQLRTRLSRVERVVGWFVMLATALLLAGFGYYVYHVAQRKGWLDVKAKYFTFVNAATGLEAGQPVKLMGFDVGQITKITAMPADDPNFNVYVEFEVKEPYYGYIWTDSKAKVVTADLLGRRYIELTKGSSGSQVEHLSYEYDKKTMKLTKMWDKGVYQPLTPKNKGFWVLSEESPALNERLERVANRVESALPNILNLTNQISLVLSNAAELAANLDANTQQLRPILDNAAWITARLTNGPGALGEWLLPPNLSQQLQETLASANSTLQVASNTLTNTDHTLKNADTNLVMLARGLNQTLINLANITGNLNQQVQANDQILSQISKAIIDADELMQGLKKHWLLRSAFKDQPAPESPRQPSRTPSKGGR